ncbi:GvpL/GvpF family gas vesicle protein [Plantactinospora endophytica]|uniref:Gas vesicle protein n=1 Tax=Plantactinospora endophytica TaxID=673535 RepID=A0ABQ4EDM5_9ACTN|nr:GvpL/GvpF family gas vesicle protein [Plantactinospora endophytica]GIG92828.1 gas vesicle protein [Plantactinospora endophytica]
MSDGQAFWLHGVTRQLRTEQLAGLTGTGGGPVEAVRVGDLVAVVARVDPDGYAEAALHRNLGDLHWLEEAATAHHRVVESVWRLGPVLPARLATVYRDGPALHAGVHDRRVALRTVLDQLTDRAEWGVKAYAVRSADEATEHSAGPVGGGAGAAYLRRRRAALAAGEAARQAAAEGAEAVHGALAGLAGAARRHRPQDRSLSGVAEPMVLNGAYLLPAERAAEFAELLRVLGARHPALRLELTGPWPPYSFAGLEDSETEDTEAGNAETGNAGIGNAGIEDESTGGGGTEDGGTGDGGGVEAAGVDGGRR